MIFIQINLMNLPLQTLQIFRADTIEPLIDSIEVLIHNDELVVKNYEFEYLEKRFKV